MLSIIHRINLFVIILIIFVKEHFLKKIKTKI